MPNICSPPSSSISPELMFCHVLTQSGKIPALKLLQIPIIYSWTYIPGIHPRSKQGITIEKGRDKGRRAHSFSQYLKKSWTQVKAFDYSLFIMINEEILTDGKQKFVRQK